MSENFENLVYFRFIFESIILVAGPPMNKFIEEFSHNDSIDLKLFKVLSM